MILVKAAWKALQPSWNIMTAFYPSDSPPELEASSPNEEPSWTSLPSRAAPRCFCGGGYEIRGRTWIVVGVVVAGAPLEQLEELGARLAAAAGGVVGAL